MWHFASACIRYARYFGQSRCSSSLGALPHLLHSVRVNLETLLLEAHVFSRLSTHIRSDDIRHTDEVGCYLLSAAAN